MKKFFALCALFALVLQLNADDVFKFGEKNSKPYLKKTGFFAALPVGYSRQSYKILGSSFTHSGFGSGLNLGFRYENFSASLEHFYNTTFAIDYLMPLDKKHDRFEYFWYGGLGLGHNYYSASDNMTLAVRAGAGAARKALDHTFFFNGFASVSLPNKEKFLGSEYEFGSRINLGAQIGFFFDTGDVF